MTKGRIHKTSLFIQPEFKCNVGCKGCYAVKNKESEFAVVGQVAKILARIANDNTEFNQFTISLNDLDEKDAQFSVETCRLVARNVDKEKVHYACSVSSLKMYNKLLNFDDCDALSISIDQHKITKFLTDESADGTSIVVTLLKIKEEHPDLHININLLVSKETDENAFVLDSFHDIADSVHLIMNKPIDNLFNEESLDEFQDSFEGYIKHAIAIKETYGSDIDIDIDSCIRTVLKNLTNDTDFSCRAGVDHTSLWPDGKMTGCAYRMPDTLYNGKADSKIEFVDYDKLEDVKVSEFNMCLYNRLAARYGSLEGLCESIKLEADIIKGLV